MKRPGASCASRDGAISKGPGNPTLRYIDAYSQQPEITPLRLAPLTTVV